MTDKTKNYSNFSYDFTVNASLEAVADFHHDTSALKQLNPPPVIVQLHRVDPMAEGSISEFTLWFGPIPVRWRAVHSQVGPQGFTDTQAQGPMAYWKHRHQFEAVEAGKTRIYEKIEYTHPTGLRGLFTRLIFSKPGLNALFTYRKWATRRALGG
jgi:ligand-binding SRPBCC domain-containing protein